MEMLPPYPQYRRIKRVPPFYKKRTFWIYTGGAGFLLTVYYVNHLEVVPISNRRRFMDVTPKQEAKLAQQAYSEIMRRYHHNILPSWDHRTRFVRAVAQQIIRVSGMEDLKWEVHVIDSPEKNAFVLPGGKIFVFTGILPIVENQHEKYVTKIAHQVARHSAEKLSFIKIIILFQIFLSLFIDPGLLGNLFIELGIM
ncbi:8223_t:CDS:2 [Cetraspora pellucida]|uniref:8223_t:CDS:1 n=1 Tax=Cetraspora pellucida TaxID=1433469 RepID=A0A9N9C9R0_9GLOM|nr:8223_t:CDS:2 [Cetraspora pellucida]